MSGHSYFPVPLGARWTYQASFSLEDGKSQDPTIVTAVPADPGSVLNFADPQGRNGVSQKRAGEAVMLQVSGGAALTDMIPVMGDRGLEVYSIDPLAPMFVQAWSLPTPLLPGACWDCPVVWMSCGWGRTEQRLVAAADRVTVPAGSFETIQVVLTGDVARTLWLAEGTGLVKIQLPGGTVELLASSLLPG